MKHVLCSLFLIYSHTCNVTSTYAEFSQNNNVIEMIKKRIFCDRSVCLMIIRYLFVWTSEFGQNNLIEFVEFSPICACLFHTQPKISDSYKICIARAITFLVFWQIHQKNNFLCKNPFFYKFLYTYAWNQWFRSRWPKVMSTIFRNNWPGY